MPSVDLPVGSAQRKTGPNWRPTKIGISLLADHNPTYEPIHDGPIAQRRSGPFRVWSSLNFQLPHHPTQTSNQKGIHPMAVKILTCYQKRLGLPAFSSHSFQVSVETEITDLESVQEEVARLYHLLQENVDREIRQVGFVPGEDYGLHNNGSSRADTNGNHNGPHRLNGENGHHRNGNNGHPDRWSCSDKQKELILKLVDENDLNRDTVEQTALDRFGVGVRMLNKLQASGLISELLETCGKNGKSRNGGGGR